MSCKTSLVLACQILMIMHSGCNAWSIFRFHFFNQNLQATYSVKFSLAFKFLDLESQDEQFFNSCFFVITELMLSVDTLLKMLR
jgi:hypothetical protein